ncbi:MAG TPA: DUF2071 domain-containing protein [Gemmatimonadota bacterium]|jgi:uncharacterized protein YqjF (DUF2071 family)
MTVAERATRGPAALRQARSLEATAHRPWPPPSRPWVMGQTWEDLLFAHWRVAPALLREKVPAPLELDLFEGTGWLGVTPFRVTGLRPRGVPPLPGVSSFPEINVRTYVTFGGRPGVWFFSLDAGNRLAVAAARRLYRLPYQAAGMTVARAHGSIRFASRRLGEPSDRWQLRVVYAPVGEPVPPRPGSREHFLTERYRLYTVDGERVTFADIHHRPWPLQEAEATFEVNTMAPTGIQLNGPPDTLHFSRRQDVVVWAPGHAG